MASQGLIKTSLAFASVVAAFVATSPLATADVEADSPVTTAGASTSYHPVKEAVVPGQSSSAKSALPKTPALTAAPSLSQKTRSTSQHQKSLHRANEVQAPLAANTTTVASSTRAYRSPNAVDTSNLEAVRAAYIRHYVENDKQVLSSMNADTAHCKAGRVNPIAADMVVDTWNFFRSLNNLDAVSIDPASPLSAHTQEAALTEAAENYEGEGGLSHYPLSDHFKCATENADQAASQSNLAQANGFTPAQQILWWYQDWSGYGESTLTHEGFNDRLGHRSWLMNPYIKETGYGDVRGYNALAVMPGGRYSDYDGARMANMNATAPATLSWPSAGYFPAELLTATDAAGFPDTDVERWSFSARNADFSQANVSVNGPQGNVPTRVVKGSMKYAPESISGYSTILFKMDMTKVKAPQGSSIGTYTVHVSGVKNTPQSSYTYQVKLFNANVTPDDVKPRIFVSRKPLALEGAPAIPADVRVIGKDVKLRWQRSSDKGQTWEDVPDDPSLFTSDMFTQPSGTSWSPNVKVCEKTVFDDAQSCPLTREQALNYRFRLKATNEAGTTYSPVLKADWTGFAPMPDSVKAGQKLSARLKFEGNGDWATTTSKVTWVSKSKGILKQDDSQPLDTTSLKGEQVRAKGSVWIWTRDTGSVHFVPITKYVTIR